MTYPIDIDILDDFFRAPNRANTTLSDAISNSDLTINLVGGSTFSTGRQIISIEDELIIIASRSGNVLTVEASGRGVFGTGAVGHASTTKVRVTFTGEHHEVLARTLIALQTELFFYRKEVKQTFHDVNTDAPGSPSTGDRYITGPDSATPSDDWDNQNQVIAEFNGASWDFITPTDGMMVFVSEVQGLNAVDWYHYNGTTWEKVGVVTATNTIAGILEIMTFAEYRNKTANKYVTPDIVYDAAAEVAITSATSITVDLDAGINFNIDPLDDNMTFENFDNVQELQSGRIHVVRGQTGGTITWADGFRSADGLASFTSPNVLEVAATGTATLAGASGSVDGMTINSVEVMSGSEAFDTDLTTTAVNVAANITANTSAPDYTATSAGAIVTVKAANGVGAGANTFALVTSLTTMTSTDVNMANGVDGSVSNFFYTGNKDGTVTIGIELDVKA